MAQPVPGWGTNPAVCAQLLSAPEAPGGACWDGSRTPSSCSCITPACQGCLSSWLLSSLQGNAKCCQSSHHPLFSIALLHREYSHWELNCRVSLENSGSEYLKKDLGMSVPFCPFCSTAFQHDYLTLWYKYNKPYDMLQANTHWSANDKISSTKYNPCISTEMGTGRQFCLTSCLRSAFS